MSSRESIDSVTDRLARHIEALQAAFRTLSASAPLREQAGLFLGVLRGFFTGAEIGLFARPAPSKSWEHLAGTGADSPAPFPAPPPDDRGTACAVGQTGRRISLVHRFADQVVLGTVLTAPAEAGPYSDADMLSLRLFVTLFDNARQDISARRNERELIFSLNHRVLQLNSLIDTGIEISQLTHRIPPHHLALERAAALSNASKGTLQVTNGTRVIETLSFPEGDPPPRSAPGYGITSGFTFAGDGYRFDLYDKESRNGIIPFEETDQLLLDALSRQVLASLENRSLHKQALEKQKIEQDIAVAASIQQRILPRILPRIEGYDIAGINIPSKSVGGDYFDCIPLPGERYALIVADVSGKGVPAALLVSSLHAYLSAYLEGTMPLIELTQRLNRVIGRASTDDKFITAFFALLTPATGDMEAVNAGHNPVFLLRNDGTLHELNRGGVPLGMLEIDFPYQSERVTIQKGERLLLYTDGIPEAANDRNELFDSKVPLKEFMARHKPESADVFVRDLIAGVRSFTGEAPQNDDITALYLMRI